MPGWVRAEGALEDDSGFEPTGVVHSGRQVNTRDPVIPANSVAEVQTPTAKTNLTQSQRDELIAEILGDVVALADQVHQVAGQVQALGQAFTSNDFVRWRNTLDMKLSELAEVNLSEQSAKRLQSFAQAYIEQLLREANTLVTLQVKSAVADTLTFNQLFDKLNRDWLLRMTAVAGASFVATLLAHVLWTSF